MGRDDPVGEPGKVRVVEGHGEVPDPEKGGEVEVVRALPQRPEFQAASIEDRIWHRRAFL